MVNEIRDNIMHGDNKLDNRLGSNPTLVDRFYEPDISSLGFRLTVKRFRDKKTGAVVMPSWPYSMPQLYDGRVLGVYTPSEHEIAADITLPTAEYKDTLEHELYHAKGHGEWMTRYLNNDSPADYN